MTLAFDPRIGQSSAMHPNPAFRKTETQINLSFARVRSFGTLAVNHDDGPLLSHIPFVLSPGGDVIELHLVRSNPIARLAEAPLTAVIAVQGPHSYISPDWYGVPDQVPTWNYVAVHLRGTLERLEDAALPGMLDRLSAQFESRLPKPPWTADKMTPAVLNRMLRSIVPCRLSIADVQGTWKAGQNKDEAARLAAADAIERDGIGENLAALARLMRTCNPDPVDSGYQAT